MFRLILEDNEGRTELHPDVSSMRLFEDEDGYPVVQIWFGDDEVAMPYWAEPEQKDDILAAFHHAAEHGWCRLRVEGGYGW